MKASSSRFQLSAIAAALGIASLLVTAVQPSPAKADAENGVEGLREGFTAPPADARPWTWFHVMSGNMSRAGITKDLESLAEVGVGGIVVFHVTQGIPHGTVRFNSPEHLDLMAHIAAECERLGLAFNFHNADGWSSTGGPWVTPEQSMKRLVWSEALVTGGEVSIPLAQPTTRAGFYRDVAVIAYPTLPSEKRDAGLRPVVTASDPAFDTALVTDGNSETLANLSLGDAAPRVFTSFSTSASATDAAGKKLAPGWVQFRYDAPVTIRSLLLENSPTRGMRIALESSQDGQQWQAVKTFDTRRIGKAEWMVDDSFAPVTAQYFRIVTEAAMEFGEISLSTIPLIRDVTLHTSMAQGRGTQLPARLDAAEETLIDPAQIIDLSQSLDSAGRLSATLPAGEWTVMRFGYTSTGALNVNPSPEGEGLEVDKFSAAAFKAHYDAFIGPVLERARAVAPTATNGVMIDSFEVGGQNWTDGYDAIFAEHFGQSVVPWLPIYTGRLVSSAAETRAMLQGIRELNADLMRDNYYVAFADLMEEQGLDSFIQPYGMGAYDDVDIGSTASVPTGEFWMERTARQMNSAVSAARLYDKKMVAAEAFTGLPDINWSFTPVRGKKWGDLAWTAGINQFMFHRFAHQANIHVMPGMTMNRWGSHFDRTQPWWDEGGKAWFAYMARGHFLLRQGLPMADVAMYVGEDSPVGCSEKNNHGDRLPLGVEFDCLNEETLLSRSRFVDGQMELPNGARYAMIWWPQNRAPGAAAQARLAEARAAGVPVAMANEGEDAKAIFAAAGLAPRIISDGPLPLFTQRRVGEADVFFLLNFGEEAQDYDLAFAARGNAPQLWDPVTGRISVLPATMDADGRTRVKMTMLAGQSAFVVFDPANDLAVPAPGPASVASEVVQQLAGPWSIAFDPLYSDAGTITVPQLFDLATSENDEIRHFSGKATYRTAFAWDGRSIADDARIMLDLGQVEVAATVRLNGVELGTAWTYPFAVELGKAIRSGENVLEIEVANLWVNRLIGDAALPDTSGYAPTFDSGFGAKNIFPDSNMVDWYSANQPQPAGPRRTFTTASFHTADDPLIPSGLIGPVQIMIETAPN